MKGLTGFPKQSTPTAADTHSPDTFRFLTVFVEKRSRRLRVVSKRLSDNQSVMAAELTTDRTSHGTRSGQ